MRGYSLCSRIAKVTLCLRVNWRQSIGNKTRVGKRQSKILGVIVRSLVFTLNGWYSVHWSGSLSLTFWKKFSGSYVDGWMMVCWGRERIVPRWGMVRFWAYFEDDINRWGVEYAKEDSRIGQALGLSLWKDGIGIDRLWVKTIGRRTGGVNVGILMMTDMPVQHPGAQERHLTTDAHLEAVIVKWYLKPRAG